MSSIKNRLLLVTVLALAGVHSFARAAENPQGVVQLSAQGVVEVQQDLLTISLNATRDGPDGAAVQTQLKAALEQALAEARKSAQPGQLDVRTGNFSLYPRHGRDGKISGWQGTAEMILEGRDFARIGAVAGRIQSMTLSNVSFGLSREQRASVESQAQAAAIERFKTRASEIARGFGYTGYTLREVSVQSNDQGFIPRMRVAMAESRALSSDAAVPVEAGKSTVSVTVSGSVQLK